MTLLCAHMLRRRQTNNERCCGTASSVARTRLLTPPHKAEVAAQLRQRRHHCLDCVPTPAHERDRLAQISRGEGPIAAECGSRCLFSVSISQASGSSSYCSRRAVSSANCSRISSRKKLTNAAGTCSVGTPGLLLPRPLNPLSTARMRSPAWRVLVPLFRFDVPHGILNFATAKASVWPPR
jgi:hypothetical protein